MSSQIFVNSRPYQTRIAFLEEGILKNISYYQKLEPSMMGSIYKGRVLKVNSVLNFAFVDIGQKKACFLYGKDLADPSQQVSEVLKTQQEILIQITADPMGDKGPRCSTEISLPGFFMVYMPQAKKKLGFSKQITDEKERQRLKSVCKDFGAKGTIIIRTLAQGKSQEHLKKDLEGLQQKWRDLQVSFKNKKEFGAVLKTEDHFSNEIKDIIHQDIDSIVIDNKDLYLQLRQDLASDSQLQKKIKYHAKKQALFQLFNIEDQISKALKKKVFLKNGGSLVFEELEAFIVIDVNTSRYKGGKNLADSILCVNKEAALKIAEQIILRHLGGIILIDFIDMEDRRDQREVVQCLHDALKKHKAKFKVFPMGDLGLVQITRKRKGLSLSQTLKETCSYCKGQGDFKKMSVIAAELLYFLEGCSPKFQLPFFKKTKKVEVACHSDLKAWIEDKEEESLDFLREKSFVEVFFKPDDSLKKEDFKMLNT